jgi:8-oxo-dGTP diphosphatase
MCAGKDAQAALTLVPIESMVGLMPEIARRVEDVEWETLSFTEHAVLCFVVDGDQVLLIHKKTGLGQGKINGPGGRIEPGELAPDAAIRETREETGITPGDLSEMARLAFLFTDGYSLACTVFVASTWTGAATDTREADPFWCSRGKIPYAEMWEDDALWLPHALGGTIVDGQFVFEGDHMLSHRIRVQAP